ncbi:glycosyltransferase [Adlercreutzia sp. ZJ242]|uniref:glycosyltransferase n=1 Tax=Adlercreutzia sp. ZJ242 TaxID=2709409 RepID=UPI0013EA9111|nr:glycosyltransferase [Adlercreutzia sp. ZJ242]
MSKILIYSEAWGRGGIETFVRNVLPTLVEAGFEADIFSTWDWEEQDDVWLESLGVNRSAAFKGFRPGQVRRLVEGPRAFRRLLNTGGYDVVWVNAMNGMGFRFAREAERVGVPVRVVHSHNSDVGDGAKLLKRAAGNFGIALWGGSSTKNIACSADAGRYLFRGRPFDVVSNGVDVGRFRFSQAKRERAREELGVDDDVTLVGSIGRIDAQKNPLFQVEVFAEYRRMDAGSKYLMLGQPAMVDEVLERARQLGVDGALIVHEPVQDPSPYYSALDAFLMPSLHEGLAFVQIEAQCASLPVLCTDAMPEEADLTELSQRCSLNDPPVVWAERLRELVEAFRGKRCGFYADEVERAGFSSDACARKVIEVISGAQDGL